MKILYVVHYFLPRHQAGTEIYTGLLANEFNKNGHEVTVFTSEDGTPKSGRFEIQEEKWRGVPVYKMIRGEPPDFERSYTDPEVDELFRDFLEQKKPDIVHFQHTFRLSAGMINVCKELGIPAIVTLADYWFICPPILLLQPNFQLCPGPDPDRCARCGNSIGALYAGTPGTSLLQSDNKALKASGQLVSKGFDSAVNFAHSVKRKLPQGLVDNLRKMKRAAEDKDPESGFNRRREMIVNRQEVMQEALGAANLVIAPSEFLRSALIDAGAVEPDKIIYSDYGFNKAGFLGLSKNKNENPKFGFIGTPVEHKGAHVAVEAMQELSDTALEFYLYGDLSWFPAYAKRLKKLASGSRVKFMGRFENEDAPQVLADLDAIVVPSLWYENSPLTIHEAFMAGTPVIVSDMGGMAELVKPGGGKTFKTGYPKDLARVFRELVENPELLDEMKNSIPHVKSVEENCEELMGYYKDSFGTSLNETEGWIIDIDEVSAGAYKICAKDTFGRTIEMSGTDPELLIKRCKDEIYEMIKRIKEIDCK